MNKSLGSTEGDVGVGPSDVCSECDAGGVLASALAGGAGNMLGVLLSGLPSSILQ
jgi:hypothetical protein